MALNECLKESLLGFRVNTSGKKNRLMKGGF